MKDFIPVETPGGTVWAEIDEAAETGSITLTSGEGAKVLKTFEAAVEALKKNAEHVISQLKELGPTEVQVSFGIKVGAEAGIPFFGLAKANGEASYTVTLKWAQ